MRYLFIFLLVSIFCATGSVQAQEQQNSGNHETALTSKLSAENLVFHWPTFTIQDSSSNTANILGMPVYNPVNVDTKMKVWWPASGDHYHMPNAYSRKLNLNSPDLGNEEKDNK